MPASTVVTFLRRREGQSPHPRRFGREEDVTAKTLLMALGVGLVVGVLLGIPSSGSSVVSRSKPPRLRLLVPRMGRPWAQYSSTTPRPRTSQRTAPRSEEHTSELQSRQYRMPSSA